MSKYVTVVVSTIILQIAEETDIPGYTKGVIEAFLPDDEEVEKMSKKHEKAWIAANNKRMIAICNFLNENNL